MLETYRKTEDAIVTAEANETIAQNANREIIDVTPTQGSLRAPDTAPVVDTATGEVLDESEEADF